MQVTITIPESVAITLTNAFGSDLARAIVEPFALQGYQSGQLSRFEVQQLLGFDNRWDTEEWLGKHGARWSYSQQDFDADGEFLARHAKVPA